MNESASATGGGREPAFRTGFVAIVGQSANRCGVSKGPSISMNSSSNLPSCSCNREGESASRWLRPTSAWRLFETSLSGRLREGSAGVAGFCFLSTGLGCFPSGAGGGRSGDDLLSVQMNDSKSNWVA